MIRPPLRSEGAKQQQGARGCSCTAGASTSEMSSSQNAPDKEAVGLGTTSRLRPVLLSFEAVVLFCPCRTPVSPPHHPPGECDYCLQLCHCPEGYGSLSDLEGSPGIARDCSQMTCPSGVSWTPVLSG